MVPANVEEQTTRDLGKPRATTVRQAERLVKDAARRAGLSNAPDVSPHWLRHAHASHAMDRGAKVHLVQSTLGHASVATTGRRIGRQLSKREELGALRDFVFFANDGNIRKHQPDEQTDQALRPSLLVDAVIL